MGIEVKIDLMAVADIGGQPRKLALELHRQLRIAHVQVPLPVPLVKIAHALGIEEITERDTDAYEGTLVANLEKTRGAIVLRKGVAPGRKRFSLGHEIGHFINPYHKSQNGRFECNSRGMNARRDDGQKWDSRPPYERIEIEANEFSGTLLVPIPEYREIRRKMSGCDIEHIVQLANDFGVSKEMMARTYVDSAPEVIGVITSNNGRAKKFILPKQFPYLGMLRDMPLPENSFARAHIAKGKAGTSTLLEEVRTDIWLDRRGNVETIYEQTLLQQDGWAMTMLLAEMSDEDGSSDEDDRNWNRR